VSPVWAKPASPIARPADRGRAKCPIHSGIRLIGLDLGALIAGAKVRASVEDGLRSVLTEVSESDGGRHGAGVGSVSSLNCTPWVEQRSLQRRCRQHPQPVLLARATALHRGHHPEDFAHGGEGRRPHRRFQLVVIREPSREVEREILRASKTL